jgi:hypothetical protein
MLPESVGCRRTALAERTDLAAADERPPFAALLARALQAGHPCLHRDPIIRGTLGVCHPACPDISALSPMAVARWRAGIGVAFSRRDVALRMSEPWRFEATGTVAKIDLTSLRRDA